MFNPAFLREKGLPVPSWLESGLIDPLVSPDLAADRLGDPGYPAPRTPPHARRSVSPVTAATAMANPGHIPGAVFFDINAIADPTPTCPTCCPRRTAFASLRRARPGARRRIVVYDNNRYSAPRAWWMLRLFGHPEVAVLDGGLAEVAGRRTAGRRPASGTAREAHFTARQNHLLVRDLEQIRANLVARREQVIDARSSGRFAGTEPEPRAGLRGRPYPAQPESAPPRPDRRRRHAAPRRTAAPALRRPRPRSAPLVATCGSGVTACTVALALHQLGAADVAVYDGSWSEWGGRSDTPDRELIARAAPAGKSVPTLVTYLEMTSEPPARPLRSPLPGIEIRLARQPTASFYRYLYGSIGRDWTWVVRQLLSDAELLQIIADPAVEVNVLWVEGVPAGYAELDRRAAPDVELAYFGLRRSSSAGPRPPPARLDGPPRLAGATAPALGPYLRSGPSARSRRLPKVRLSSV